MEPVHSLERVTRSSLRAAVSSADAPLRSHSQGAATSRLPADVSVHTDSRLPGAVSAASFDDIGSPLRARVRTPATPAAIRATEYDVAAASRLPADAAVHDDSRLTAASSVATEGVSSRLRARAHTPPAALAAERASSDFLRLETENVDLRHRLELSEQRAESAQRYAELQASTDATIRDLMASRTESRAPVQHLPQLAAGTAADTHRDALQLALSNMNTMVGNPTLVANVKLGVVVDVKRVNDACTALLKLLGTLRGALDYERYLRHVLQLSKPGADEPGNAFAESAACTLLDTLFHIDSRPTSPEGSASSASASGDTCQRLIEARTAKVTFVLSGDGEPGGVDPHLILGPFRIIDSMLFTHLNHLIDAPPGSAVYDGFNAQRTFFGAIQALLQTAGHGLDQDRDRRYKNAYGPCIRYDTHGGVSDLTTEQLADIIKFDLLRRLHHSQRIDLVDQAKRLALAGLPGVTGGNRAAVLMDFTQAVMQHGSDGDLDLDAIDLQLRAVVQKYRDVRLTGSYTPTDPAGLAKVLHVHPTPRPPAVAAAAVRPGPEPPKPAARKGQPRQQLPAAGPSAVAGPTAEPPPGKQMCNLGLQCRRTVLELDPANPNRPIVAAKCWFWHASDQYANMMQQIRAEFAATLLAPPAKPVVMPASVLPAPAPTPPVRTTQAAVLQSHIAELRPGRPSAPATRPEAADVGECDAVVRPVEFHAAAISAFVRAHQPDQPYVQPVSAEEARLDALQAALDGYELAFAACAEAARSVSGDGRPLHYHRDLLRLWDVYIEALAADLPGGSGVAFLATAAKVRDRFIVDTGSYYNIGPHVRPDGSPDASGATSSLVPSSSTHSSQTAGGDLISLNATFSSQVLVRTRCGQLICIQWRAYDMPRLRTRTRALHVLSGANLIDNKGRMTNKPPEQGGSYFQVMTTDPDCPAEPAFLSGRIDLDFAGLGAAEPTVAVRQPGERHHLAILRPSDPSSGSSAALAVRFALQAARMPLSTDSLHTAMAAVCEQNSDPVSHSPILSRQLQQFLAAHHLPQRADEFVQIVEIYPAYDVFDVEPDTSPFYDVPPAHFEWDDRSGGVHRRMIQRFSRRFVNQLPAAEYNELVCTAAQLLAEIEQQLSLLVQGLVKARRDAVDGDGAMLPGPVSPAADRLLDSPSPNSPITPLSRDDSSCEEGAAVAATVVPTPPCDILRVGVATAGAAGTSAPAGETLSLLAFLTQYELHQYHPDFLRAGYTSTADLPQTPFDIFFDCPPLSVMQAPEQGRIVRLLGGRRHLRPSAAGVSALSPVGCKASVVLPTDRRELDDDDGERLGDAPSGQHKRAKSAPTSSAAAAGASVPGSGAPAGHATDLSWLTDGERETIAYHTWSTDIHVRGEATDTVAPDAVTMPAVHAGDDGDGDDDGASTAVPGRFGLLAGVNGPVSWTPRRSRHAATAAVLFTLCMCAHQLPGRPCLGRPTLGSTTCADCRECSDGRVCINSDRAPFCSAVVPPTCYRWPPGATKAVFLDPAAGHLSYSIARLLEAPTAIALAWDILPPEVALADVMRAYPHLLPRVVYAQVVPGTLITPELVTDMLASMCDAAIPDVVELMCGPCCTTTSCRSGKQQNPHRRRIDGVLRPVTYEAAVADVFYSSLFDTIRHIRSVNRRCSFILENPADGLLRELPQVQALLADMPAHFVVHDHCVLATEPIDCWHGSTQKPTQFIVIGYDADDLPPSLRCAKLGCEHRLSFDADACHRLVQQLPAKRRRREGQLRVSAESAARIPVGVFKYAFPLSARLHPMILSAPQTPDPAAVPASSPADLEPYGAYLSLRVPPDHRLQRLTPLTCVFDAPTLHAVCGHTLRGQRLADSANHWQGFRMLSSSGQLLSAPNITAADVRLDAHCDICTRTQMQAAPSHRVHPRAGRQLPVPVACLAPFGLPDVATLFLNTGGPWYSEPVPTPTWNQWLLPAAASSDPTAVAMPALAQTADHTSALDEGEDCLSDSSGYATPTHGRCPTSSDDDPEAERDVDTIPTFPTISDRIFTHPNALGTDCRTFEALEMLPDHMRKGRIVHFDIVHSELASVGRPLKAGVKHFLVCVDVGIHHLAFRPIRSTKDIARAYRELAIELGWTTQRHTCHCVTDGEPGLMAPVRAAAAAMGQSFDTLPPYAANANHAGSLIIKHARAAVRGYVLGASEHPMSVINGSFEAYAWNQAVLVHNMTSILGHPLRYSPYRLAHGVHPVFTSIPFGAKVYIHIPKDSRLHARNRGDNSAANRSEPGVAIGPRSQQDSLPVILTSRNTTKASRATYMAPAGSPLGVIGVVPPLVPVSAATHVDAAIAVVSKQVEHDKRVRNITRVATKMLTAHDASIVLRPGPLIDRAKPYISQRCKSVVGLSIAAALDSTFPAADGSDLPYRRADLQWDLDHDYLLAALSVSSEGAHEQYDSECAQAAHLACLALPSPGLDPIAYACPVSEQRTHIDALVAIVAMTDLPWKAYLNGPEREHVMAAWNRELRALLDLNAIVPLVPGSPDYEEAVKSKTTTPCRVLLDFKRDGTWKCRVVTRGDLEDKVALDGPDFHYYSNVSRMSTVRCAALRAGRDTPRPGRAGGRIISSCDVSNAFLQTTPFPDTDRRFLMIRSPIDGTVTYYRQLISVYGSCSAPARWETTFSTWLTSPESAGGPGLVRGMNEPSAYYHPGRDLLMVLYTDDQLLDGYREDIDWYYTLLRARFKIKEPKWLTPDNPIDHLGVTIFQTDSHTYMTMQNYIRSMNIVLQRDPSKCLHRKSPIPHKHEIVDLTPLSHTKEAFFVRALGMCSWISATVRLDGRYAQSRISQYASAPCVGAYNALIHLLDYYTATSHLCIRHQSVPRRPSLTVGHPT